MDFGATSAGFPVEMQFVVKNQGEATLTLGAITAPSGFTVTQGFGQATLEPE